MNNPGIDLEIWKQLRKKWDELDIAGHRLKIHFQLITSPEDRNKVLMIDIIQNIDEETVTETVQHIAREAYGPLGIADASLEQLIAGYRQTLRQVHRRAGQAETLIVTMSPTSPTSGEVRAILENSDSGSKSSIPINYQHYYTLVALREKMMEMLGDEWNKVKVIYRKDQLDFHFDY